MAFNITFWRPPHRIDNIFGAVMRCNFNFLLTINCRIEFFKRNRGGEYSTHVARINVMLLLLLDTMELFYAYQKVSQCDAHYVCCLEIISQILFILRTFGLDSAGSITDVDDVADDM